MNSVKYIGMDVHKETISRSLEQLSGKHFDIMSRPQGSPHKLSVNASQKDAKRGGS